MVIDWAETRVKLVSAGRVRCELGWRLTERFWRKLSDFDLWFVWAGHGHMRTNAGDFTLRPGMCFWMRPGGVYEAEQDPDNRVGASFIHFDLIGPRGRLTVEDPLPPLAHDVADVNLVDAIMRRTVQLKTLATQTGAKSAEPTATALFTGLLMDLDAQSQAAASSITGGTERHHYQLVTTLASRIAESPKDVPSIAALAEEAGYSPEHFGRVFRTVMGQSPQSFIIQARIDRARSLLLESDMSITQIADAVGCGDVFFFSRQFKQKAGISPMAYRKRQRGTRVGRGLSAAE